VHALSTVDGFTVCIDLDALAGTSTAALDLKLRPNAHKLQVQDRGTPVAVVQTDTFDVTNPPPPTKRTIQPVAPKANESTGMPWWLVVVAIGGIGAALGATTRRAHTAPDPTET
jgi:hypothetical protein